MLLWRLHPVRIHWWHLVHHGLVVIKLLLIHHWRLLIERWIHWRLHAILGRNWLLIVNHLGPGRVLTHLVLELVLHWEVPTMRAWRRHLIGHLAAVPLPIRVRPHPLDIHI